MAIAALLTWLVTAVLGFTMLGLWVRGGGVGGGAATATTRFAPGLIFGHFVLAAIGLLVWIWYVVTDVEALTWVAFVLLVVIAVLGDVMFVRWFRDKTGTSVESKLPKPVVYIHGLFAVTTVVLVLLVALGVGGS
ncbi:MAG TPA: hypothetical protein VE287_03425 [Actinopolymorphaceae bacterium]|nr:hypothetical protein [Actinopolymorphaceae bacterium]